MQIEQIRAARVAEPFRPFTIRTADGRAFHVPHREFVWIPPNAQRTVVVSNTAGTDEYAMLDSMLVTALEFGERRNGPDRAAS